MIDGKSFGPSRDALQHLNQAELQHAEGGEGLARRRGGPNPPNSRGSADERSAWEPKPRQRVSAPKSRHRSRPSRLP